MCVPGPQWFKKTAAKIPETATRSTIWNVSFGIFERPLCISPRRNNRLRKPAFIREWSRDSLDPLSEFTIHTIATKQFAWTYDQSSLTTILNIWYAWNLCTKHACKSSVKLLKHYGTNTVRSFQETRETRGVIRRIIRSTKRLQACLGMVDDHWNGNRITENLLYLVNENRTFARTFFKRIFMRCTIDLWREFHELTPCFSIEGITPHCCWPASGMENRMVRMVESW